MNSLIEVSQDTIAIIGSARPSEFRLEKLRKNINIYLLVTSVDFDYGQNLEEQGQLEPQVLSLDSLRTLVVELSCSVLVKAFFVQILLP